MRLQSPTITILGPDPARKYRINANSFQQNALTTSNGWQYAAFYTDKKPQDDQDGKCFVNLARRRIQGNQEQEMKEQSQEWTILTFDDYEQTIDDGHNTISMAVCEGDGTIHVAFDHHCNELKFRISQQGVSHDPSVFAWNVSLFGKTRDFLPGLAKSGMMEEVTYPRFVNLEKDLLLTYRIGQAGAGSDILYRYSSTTHQYTFLGQHLTGISNNPYINGIDYRLSRLHISWCYRNFVEFPASSSADAHKQQAGPNGPEQNFDLNYAFSDDQGLTWRNSAGKLLADIRASKDRNVEDTIKSGAIGARVFEIPMHSGILNQESQCPDFDGGFWVLNRQKVSGHERWMVYYRDPKGAWTKIVLESATMPTETGSRGSICVDRRNNVYVVLPGNSDSSLEILEARKDIGRAEFTQIWQGSGFDGEPLVDVQKLEMSDYLSIFTRTCKSEDGAAKVVVLDFEM